MLWAILSLACCSGSGFEPLVNPSYTLLNLSSSWSHSLDFPSFLGINFLKHCFFSIVLFFKGYSCFLLSAQQDRNHVPLSYLRPFASDQPPWTPVVSSPLGLPSLPARTILFPCFHEGGFSILLFSLPPFLKSWYRENFSLSASLEAICMRFICACACLEVLRCIGIGVRF